MPACCLERREPEPVAKRRDRLLGQLARHGQSAGGERARCDVAEHDVGVGHGRLDPAEAVAGRAGRRARAARADVQAAGLVEPGDRAAAGADLGDVDRRDADQLAAAAKEPAARGEGRADLVLLAERYTAVLDQRSLRRRASEVERDRVLVPEGLRERERRDDARGRAGFQRIHRASGRVVAGHRAAGGLEDGERRRHARGVEPSAQIGRRTGSSAARCRR